MSKRSRDSSSSSPPTSWGVGEGEEEEITFIVGNVRNGTQLEYVRKTFGKDTRFDQGADSVIYGLYFTDRLVMHIDRVALYVLHRGNVIFSTMVMPDRYFETVEYADWRYLIFETHQLITERPIAGNGTSDENISISGLFIQLVNVDTSASLSNPRIQPAVDMALSWFEQVMGPERFNDTIFFPYDIDPAKYNIKVDLSTIPQRTPLWFKARGFGGTKAYRALGFYVPTAEEDGGWTFDGGDTKPMDAFQKSRMRFGALAEDEASVLYMLARPQVKISMWGWCKTPPSMKLPTSWGCSPDGTVYDPSMSAAKIPESIWSLLSDTEKGWDVCKGALEIKSSKNSLKFNAYYLPQVYMEMICTETLWCDLIRYSPKRITDMQGRWVTKHVARVYRVYRHKPTEEKMIQLWKYALDHKKQLQEIVFKDAAFIEFRKYLETVAENLSYTEIYSTPEMLPVFESYNEFKEQLVHTPIKLHKKLQGAQPARKVQKGDPPPPKGGGDEKLKQAELLFENVRQAANDGDTESLRQACLKQIQFYSDWLL